MPSIARSLLSILTLSLAPFNTSNASVTTSPAVDQSVACALTPTIPGCGTGSSASAISHTQSDAILSSELQNAEPQLSRHVSSAEAAEVMKHPRTITPDRIKISTSSLSVPLGAPFEATVELAPGELFSSILEGQRGSHGFVAGARNGPSKVLRVEGNRHVIEILPLALGAVDVEIGVLYMDNAYAAQTLHLNVIPSAKGLTKFSLAGAGSTIPLFLGYRDEDRQQALNPTVSYGGVGPAGDIYLHGIEHITVTVAQPESDPVIRIDKNGMIHALRIGKAIISGEFAGAKDQVTVDVEPKEYSPVYQATHPTPK
jgi:hypothetical protein